MNEGKICLENKMSGKASRRDGREKSFKEIQDETLTEFRKPPKREQIKAKNEAQGNYMTLISSKVITFGIGPAGTGKTYIAAAMAAEALHNKEIDRIIITRPAQTVAGEEHGFLPGTLEEKFGPYFEPFKDALEDRMGTGAVEYAIGKGGRIKAQPIAFMRGKSFSNSWVIMDEAQNITPEQMKMFLTRIGEKCKVIVIGDIEQSDIQGPNGLADAMHRFKGMPEIGIARFEDADCVRSAICRKILGAYRD